MSKAKHEMHGFTGTRIYHIWRQMKYRCTNPNAPEYRNYGGRGITVCKRWLDSFQNFYDDMKVGYSEKLTLERKDVNKEYSLENCHWASWKEQHRNRRNNANFTAFGKTQCITAWSEEYDVPVSTIKNRMKRSTIKKMTFEQALTASLYAQQRGKLK